MGEQSCIEDNSPAEAPRGGSTDVFFIKGPERPRCVMSTKTRHYEFLWTRQGRPPIDFTLVNEPSRKN